MIYPIREIKLKKQPHSRPDCDFQDVVQDNGSIIRFQARSCKPGSWEFYSLVDGEGCCFIDSSVVDRFGFFHLYEKDKNYKHILPLLADNEIRMNDYKIELGADFEL